MLSTQEASEKLISAGLRYTAGEVANLARLQMFPAAQKDARGSWQIPHEDVDLFISRQKQARRMRWIATGSIIVLLTILFAAVSGTKDALDLFRDYILPKLGVKAAEIQIQSLVLTARLTCVMKPGEELPPSQVVFWPIGDSHAYLDGPAGKVQLQFESPIRFKVVDSDKIIVINRFVLSDGSEIEGRPVDALKNYHQLSVPIVTAVYGNVLDTMKLLEISLDLNGKNVMYASWEYNVPFQQSPRFDVQLDSKSIRVFDK